MISLGRTAILDELKADLVRLQGFKAIKSSDVDSRLGPIKEAFTNGSFPLGAMHEFVYANVEDASATNGFIAGLLAALMGNKGTSVWMSCSRKLFPPALKAFGIDPDRFIFIDLKKEKEVLWAMDEALKCAALAAVVGEMRDISFTASRRLQLAVEQSQVTGFILCNKLHNLNATACISRWKISQLSSELSEGLPGIGFPTWRVELLRIRNGKPGVWDIQWIDGKFVPVTKLPYLPQEKLKKVG